MYTLLGGADTVFFPLLSHRGTIISTGRRSGITDFALREHFSKINFALREHFSLKYLHISFIFTTFAAGNVKNQLILNQ